MVMIIGMNVAKGLVRLWLCLWFLVMVWVRVMFIRHIHTKPTHLYSGTNMGVGHGIDYGCGCG